MKIDITTPVYYINLKNRIDRYQHITKMTADIGFTNVARIEAVDTLGDKISQFQDYIAPDAYNDLVENNKLGMRQTHQDLTNGSIGCYLSHLMVYQEMIDNNIENALIFEDDLIMLHDKTKFWELIDTIKIPDNADIFFLDAQTFKKKRHNQYVIKFNHLFCTHFYFITNKGARKILERSLPIRAQIDAEMSILNMNSLVSMYAYYYGERIGRQNVTIFNSDIQNLPCNENGQIFKYMSVHDKCSTNIDKIRALRIQNK